MAQVVIENAQKAYGAAKVIHGVDITVEDGEFVVLVGPSGCGKSTLLRMIAGLEGISGGTISIGSEVVNDIPPKQRDIAMVFQSYALYPHMTVEQNMGFSLRLSGVPEAERQEKVARAAAILGLEPLLKRYPKELSGGQRQRVAMGRAIVRNPKVFLFDEPLSNLDAKLRVQMRAEIKELHQRLKTTTVYVTHDQVEAMTMADKIVVMRDGKVEQVGAPLELYDKPANLFVASFLGSPGMNFLKGQLSATDTSIFETEGGSRVRLNKPLSAISPQQPLTLGIRPEHMAVASSSEDGAIDADLVVVEPTGAETMLQLDHAGNRITTSCKQRIGLHQGQKVRLTLQSDKVHLFDSVSGLAVAA